MGATIVSTLLQQPAVWDTGPVNDTDEILEGGGVKQPFRCPGFPVAQHSSVILPGVISAPNDASHDKDHVSWQTWRVDLR